MYWADADGRGRTRTDADGRGRTRTEADILFLFKKKIKKKKKIGAYIDRLGHPPPQISKLYEHYAQILGWISTRTGNLQFD